MAAALLTTSASARALQPPAAAAAAAAAMGGGRGSQSVRGFGGAGGGGEAPAGLSRVTSSTGSNSNAGTPVPVPADAYVYGSLSPPAGHGGVGKPFATVHVLLLDTTTDEEEEFVLYSGTLKGDGAAATATATVGPCAPEVLKLGGVLLASVDMLSRFVGEPGRMLDVEVGGLLHTAVTLSSGTVVLAIVTPRLHLELNTIERTAKFMLDALVTMLGPMKTKLDGWSKTQIESVLTRIGALFAQPHIGLHPVILWDAAPAVPVTGALQAVFDEMLTEVVSSVGDDTETSVDGVRYLIPIGAVLIHGGRILLSHLPPTDLLVVYRSLLLVNQWASAPGSPASQHIMQVTLATSDRGRVAPHSYCVGESNFVKGAASVPPVANAAVGHIAAVSEEDTSIAMLFMVRPGVANVPMEPFMLDAARGALYKLRASGFMREFDNQLQQLRGNSRTVSPTTDAEVKGSDDPMDAAASLHTFARNFHNCMVVLPAGVATHDRVAWLNAVETELPKAIEFIRTALQAMNELQDDLPAFSALPKLDAGASTQGGYSELGDADFDRLSDDEALPAKPAPCMVKDAQVLDSSADLKAHCVADAREMSVRLAPTPGVPASDIWVIGRILPPYRECFVVCEGRAHMDEDVLDAAFQQHFGWD